MGRSKNWLLAIDESGGKSTSHYGFGALIMPYDRRGDFIGKFKSLCEFFGYENEVKWKRVNKRSNELVTALVDYFFETPWLFFHCFVACKADIRKELSQGDYDLAWRKHLATFVANKCRRAARHDRTSEHRFTIWVDPIQSRYAKADEALQNVVNNSLRSSFGGRAEVDNVITHDSKLTPAIQLCDVILGAIVTSWLPTSTAQYKPAMRDYVANRLGWVDLRADTRPEQRKLNIWYFYDRSLGPRRVETRSFDPQKASLHHGL